MSLPGLAWRFIIAHMFCKQRVLFPVLGGVYTNTSQVVDLTRIGLRPMFNKRKFGTIRYFDGSSSILKFVISTTLISPSLGGALSA